ncbi:hypothetical protein PITCH_A780110 [uncultured Desulfobacterium sp.]|uniref:Uncharacterized protein n=1 Tax=uncultured Desulfobacterium sp. TaxID=201089 RepID=A0A445N2P1_9BACT|nr:hypothetical protein PITCH_A780110 [uncultured Desulfobacterium sp.]
MKSVIGFLSNVGMAPQVHIRGGECLNPEEEQEWQRAQRRVLLYLHMLDIPAVETLDLALEALRRARDKNSLVETSPTAGAMRAIHSLLIERGYYSDSETPCFGLTMRLWRFPESPDKKEIRAMPTLNRGFMLPRRR